MTRPSALVLDGNVIKVRLQAERVESRSAVHVDWVRFTCYRRNAPAPSIDLLFPSGGDYDAWQRTEELARAIAEVPDCDTGAAAQALELAQDVAAALGREFIVAGDLRKGHDFYKHRIAIERAGAEVAWVGFGASSASPRQQAQARTLHVNVMGAACTFAEGSWRERLATIINDRKATITRCDLALDFFEGVSGGMRRVTADYDAGLMDVSGKRPKCNHVGDWSAHSQGARSFYFGSKEAGKQSNVYEKGDQLFGVEAGSRWMRIELRYGNKLRVLPVDLLHRPADFFAGASDWHAAMLREAEAEAVPQPVACVPRLALQSVKAEAYRSAKWTFQTAGASVAALLRFVSESDLLSLASIGKLPRRLQRFTDGELRAAFDSVFNDSREGFGSAFVRLST